MDKHAFIQACREGADKMDAALSAIYRDYRQALVREGYLVLGDVELARDLLQDTLLKAWLRCASFRGDSEVYPWLKTIFRRNLIDLVRRLHPELPIPESDEPDKDFEQALLAWRGMVDPTPEQALIAQRLQTCFQDCQKRFFADEPLAATVIRWAAEDDLKNDQIANLLNRTPGATRQFLSECRKKARFYFAEWYELLLGGAGGKKGSSNA